MDDKHKKLDRLERLKSAYSSGILRVKYADTDVTYQSLSEIKKAIQSLERDLGSPAHKIRLFTAGFDKGL